MLGSIATAFVVRRLLPAERLPLGRAQRAALALGALIGAAVGAKLPFVLRDIDGLVTGYAWLSDGRTITFGLVGGYLGVELAKWTAGVRIKTGDSFAVPVAAAIAVGRLGCLRAGCCFGVESGVPWAMDFGDGVLRHPTQAYEALFHAAMAVLLYQLGKRGLFRRQRIKLYIISYMAWRFVTEWLRPEPRGALGLTFYQWSALAFAALFALLWWLDARRAGAREVAHP